MLRNGLTARPVSTKLIRCQIGFLNSSVNARLTEALLHFLSVELQLLTFWTFLSQKCCFN
jgi:hypothetical protein